MPAKKRSNDSDLLAFAQAVGNYSDVSAAASQQRDRAEGMDTGESKIFDIEAADQPQMETEILRAPAENGAEDTDEEVAEASVREAIVPLLGVRMAVSEIDLGSVRLVRASNLRELPDDAAGSTDNVFAAIGCGGSMQAPVAATGKLRQLVTTLRLLKRGGVGLAAYGWTPGLGDWQRFSTGVGRPRPGGYELSAGDAEALSELSNQIAGRETRTPAFAWALSRFDLGAERTNQVEALSDYLLALRALLEGGGPAKAGMTARASALCAGPDERDGIRASLERALALERKLMSGNRVKPGDGSPLEAIAAVEEVLRTLLRGMATGELGSDLRITADEILLADGLRVGDGAASQLGETAEWRITDSDETAEFRIPDLDEAERIVAEHAALSAEGKEPPDGELPSTVVEREPVPDADWLPDKAEPELEWPAFAGPRPKSRKRQAPSERVQYLFPTPETTDWSIGDLSIERKRHRA